MTALDAATLEWAAARVGAGARVAAVRPMRRGSTDMLALDVLDAGGALRRLVLRRFVDKERLATDPWYAPGNEAKVLRLIEVSGIPAPRLVAADFHSADCDVPTLLTTRLPGRSPGKPRDTTSFLEQLAEALPPIHAVDPPPALPSYEPYAPLEEIRPPSWSPRPGMWERVLETLSGSRPETYQPFIHRDYHPGNTLWSGGRLTGIVDWTTGCVGPPGIDLARMRQNLGGDFGTEVADRFLDLYRSVVGDEGGYHPYWDLLDAADSVPDLGPPADAEDAASLLRFDDYVASVLARLSG